MMLVIGIIIAAVLVVALCMALIIGIAELVGAVRRIEHLLERIEEAVVKPPPEEPSEEKREAGPTSTSA